MRNQERENKTDQTNITRGINLSEFYIQGPNYHIKISIDSNGLQVTLHHQQQNAQFYAFISAQSSNSPYEELLTACQGTEQLYERMKNSEKCFLSASKPWRLIVEIQASNFSFGKKDIQYSIFLTQFNHEKDHPRHRVLTPKKDRRNLSNNHKQPKLRFQPIQQQKPQDNELKQQGRSKRGGSVHKMERKKSPERINHKSPNPFGMGSKIRLIEQRSYRRADYFKFVEGNQVIVSFEGNRHWSRLTLKDALKKDEPCKFSYRILKSKNRMIRFGVGNLSLTTRNSHEHRDFFCCYQGSGLVASSQLVNTKESGQGFKEGNFVSIIINLGEGSIKWYSGTSLYYMKECGVAFLDSRLRDQNLYQCVQMFDHGDQIQFINS